ncbi:MAG: serine/threonine protein kinase [Deltaproteobacteria bacterium]|nr:serine/threonine protein kinase [Deltaproteobacteria bacterium]
MTFEGEDLTGGATLAASPRALAIDPSAPPSRDPVTPAGRSSSAAIASPQAVMHLDEARRAMVFARFVSALTALVAVALFVIGGDPTYRAIHLGGLALAAGGAIWFWRVARDPASYRAWQQTVFGHCCVIAVATGFLYWGVLSAVLVVVPFGAFIFSTGQSLNGAASVTLHAALLHTALAIATSFGVVPDRGVIGPHELGHGPQLMVIAVIQFIFAATFVIARRTRQSTFDAVMQLERAIRDVGQKGALLAEAEAELRAVRQVGGRGHYTEAQIGGYTLGLLIGRGAMGEVYEAQAPRGELCAIKLLHPHLRDQPGPYRRFIREAEIAASLDVPNVVRVFAIAGPDDEQPFLAMERLHGDDLAGILKRSPTLPIAEVAALVAQVGAGLAAAHAVGIVHRDLKPGNLFLAEVGDARVWKILDFGVSKLADGGGTLTQGHVVGTPAYMAPEQARGGELDYRADLYGLGVIAYRAITGRPTVANADVPAMLYDVVYRMPARPSSLVGCPPAVDAVLAIALAKEPAERFASGAELAAALTAAAAGELSPARVARARRILATAPWGREVRRRAATPV